MYLGAQLRMFFEDEKPAILQQIDAAFEKVKTRCIPVRDCAFSVCLSVFVCLFIRLQVRQHRLLLEDTMFGVLKRKERRRLLEWVEEEQQQLLQCH